jgi:hypothetical protein
VHRKREVNAWAEDRAGEATDIIELARQYGRYGYRKVAELLRQAGWIINDKRAEPSACWRADCLQRRNGRHIPRGRMHQSCRAWADRARRPRQLRGPAELALDLLDELADFGGGCFRLLALDADQGSLVLLIIEQDVENAVRYQRDTDHRDEQRDVFGEQAPTGLCDGGLWPPLAAARQ